MRARTTGYLISIGLKAVEVADLYNCTSVDRKDAYTYLDLKVKATTEGADIKGFLAPSVLSTDSCLLTTGQTSG